MASKFESSIQRGCDFIHDFVCSPCEENGLNTEAQYFCNQCTDYYCVNCVPFHNKLFKRHSVLRCDRTDMTKWAAAPGMVDVLERCERHPVEALKLVCGDHGQLCCHVCIAMDHRKGLDVEIPSEEVGAMRISEKTERSVRGVIGLENPWNVLVNKNDKAGIETLIDNMQPPPTYETFRRAINILNGQTELVRRLCRLVSEDILELLDRTKVIKVYAAINANNPDITLIVVSRSPIPVPTYNGFPVYVKDISNAVLEDKAVHKEISRMSTSNKAELKKIKRELKTKVHTMKSAMKEISMKYMRYPNVSQISFSTVKATKFSCNNEKVYTVDCKPVICIVIYVYCKGWVPVGWESFPDIAGGYQVDVREFYELKMQMIIDHQCQKKYHAMCSI